MVKAFNAQANKMIDIKLREDRFENTEKVMKNSLSFASNLSTILSTGANTFAAKLLNGLQQGLNLGNSLIQLLSSLGSGGVTSIFGLLGKVFGFADGGKVPGSGMGDTIPAMLTPGEFVIRKDIVEKLGPSFFGWLNGGLLPSMGGHYAVGGMVTTQLPPVVKNSFDVHIDRRGDVHVVQKALQKLKSNNKYFGG
jgi:hypothetical protein